jgi:hypothetical protein
MRELNRGTFLVHGALLRANTDIATTKVSPALSIVLAGRGSSYTFDRTLNAEKDGDASGVVARAAERDGPIFEGTAGLASRPPTDSPMA